MNSRYTALVASNTHLREKIKRKVGYLSELRSKISILEEKHEKIIGELALNDAKLSNQALVVRYLENDLALERDLLSSDEFNSTLARILSLGITSGVERRLCMGCTDAQFEEATQNVSNFFLGAEAVFNKAIAALPSTHFPFLAKIVEAAESALPEIAVLLPLTSLSSTLYS
ncbi:hypothetical protein Tco_1486302 [Tanacetum coccineum]